MKAHLIRRGKHYTVKLYDAQNRKWSHRSLKTTKKAIAEVRFGQFLENGHKKELLGEFNVEPVPLTVLVKEFLDYMEANRSEAYTRLVRQFSNKWFSFFGAETLSTAISPRMIQRYVIARTKDKCRIKGTPVANATVNRDLAALKHMLHKAEVVRIEAVGSACPAAHFRSASGTEGCGHGRDPGFTWTSQRHADGKILRAPGAEQFEFGCPEVTGGGTIYKNFITQNVTQNGFCTIFGQQKRRIRTAVDWLI